MNRSYYFNYIDEKLQTLSSRIESRGKLNILDLHVHSENFYLYFFNLLYGYDLHNLNASFQNVEAIDLVDDKNKIVIQVSSTCDKNKIETALSKDILKEYKDYNFKFISISKDASYQRNNTFKNPYGLVFEPKTDIYDVTSILSFVNGLEIDRLKGVYEFIKKELGVEPDLSKFDSNLAAVINILSKEDLRNVGRIEEVKSFEIDKKIDYNGLDDVRDTIEDYAVYYKKVDEKYTEFDSFGSNKSLTVLAAIKSEYVRSKKSGDADTVFLTVVENIKDKVRSSSNIESMSVEELDLCVEILVVDAFVRCKIFKKPENN